MIYIRCCKCGNTTHWKSDSITDVMKSTSLSKKHSAVAVSYWASSHGEMEKALEDDV